MSRLKLPEYSIPRDLEEVLDKKLEAYPNMSEKSKKFMRILKALETVDHVDLSQNHYIQLLKLALFLEKYQDSVDNNKEHSESLFEITIDYDEESKPRIKLQGSIDGIDTTDNISHMRVASVTQVDIISREDSARLTKTHIAKNLYDNKFRSQNDHNYPRRCAHYALWLMHERDTLTYLFPLKNKSFIKSNAIDYNNRKAVNPAIDRNPEQKQAVLSIINKSAFPAPYILYGPPGTGKTATLVEAMCQLHRDFPGSHILVCTPSNTAADEITKRLLKFIQPEYIYRIYSQSKDGSTIDEEIRKCSNYNAGKVVYANSEDIIKKRIVISTLCNSMRMVLMRIPEDHFSHLIIDEAGHSTEPDILIPVSLISCNGNLHSQIVLAGDPQQLGPTIKSKLAAAISGRSILERITSYDTYQKDSTGKYNPNYITKLLRNYRSHPSIIHLSNKLFYDNELIPMSQKNDANEKFPVIFHGVESKEEKVGFSPSSCNQKEIQLVIKYVDDLLNNKLQIGQVLAKDIGIVTPFALQSKIIQSLLNKKNVNGINVGTVDLFQGQERKIMIMTTVRSQTFVHGGLEHIGFLSDFKRFNVAITRAKELFIVIGNPNVLRLDGNWRMLMKFCVDNKSYQGLQLSLNHLSGHGDGTNRKLKIVSSASLFEDIAQLFILHGSYMNLPFRDDYENLIDFMEDLNIYDYNYDNDEDNFNTFYEESDIDDEYDGYDDYEDFRESEYLSNYEEHDGDLVDYFEEPEDLNDTEEFYDDPADCFEDLYEHEEYHYDPVDYFEELEDLYDIQEYDDDPVDHFEEKGDFYDHEEYDNDYADYFEEPENSYDNGEFDDDPIDYFEEPEDLYDHEEYDDNPADYYEEPEDLYDHEEYDDDPADYYEEPEDLYDYEEYDDDHADYFEEPEDSYDHEEYDHDPADYYEEPEDLYDHEEYVDDPADYYEEPEDLYDYEEYDDDHADYFEEPEDSYDHEEYDHDPADYYEEPEDLYDHEEYVDDHADYFVEPENLYDNGEFDDILQKILQILKTHMIMKTSTTTLQTISKSLKTYMILRNSTTTQQTISYSLKIYMMMNKSTTSRRQFRNALRFI